MPCQVLAPSLQKLEVDDARATALPARLQQVAALHTLTDLQLHIWGRKATFDAQLLNHLSQLKQLQRLSITCRLVSFLPCCCTPRSAA